MPESVQCTIFSATMPLDVLEVTSKFMRDPIRILVKRDELTLEGTPSLPPSPIHTAHHPLPHPTFFMSVNVYPLT